MMLRWCCGDVNHVAKYKDGVRSRWWWQCRCGGGGGFRMIKVVTIALVS